MIEALTADWDPESYSDRYRERLERVIERKRKRRKIEVPEPQPEPEPAPDLMDALQRAVDNVRAGRDARAQPEGDASAEDELAGLTRDELYKRATKAKVAGRTKMSKQELVEALSE